MTFGFSTLTDLLSWVAAVALGIKVLATAILLIAPADRRDRHGWGAILWWSTKITPIVAVPCVIWVAWHQGMRDALWIFAAVMLFVVVAVPLKVRQRRRRIAAWGTTGRRLP